MSGKIKSLSLQQFRSFSEKVTFDFRQLTVLTGPNNSGKSSVIKAILLLLERSYFSNLSFNSGHHNLTSFQHTVNKDSQDNKFTLRLVVDPYLDVFDGDFGQPLRLGKHITEIELTYVKNPKDHNGALLVQANLWNAEGYQILSTELGKNSEESVKYFIPPNWLRPHDMEGTFFEETPLQIKNLDQIPTGHISPLWQANLLLKYLVNNAEYPIDKIYPGHRYPSNVKIKDLVDIDLLASFFHPVTGYQPIDDILSKANVNYLPPFRNEQRQVYLFNTHPHFADSLKRMKADDKSVYNDERNFLKRWLGKEGFNLMDNLDKISVDEIPSIGVRFQFIKGGKKVDLSNLGSGAAQLLPVLLQITQGRKERVIILEEPEVNLHPNFQAKLADMIVEAMGEPFGHQFIIETHSEYFIRKLQYLVGKKKVKPELINLFYIRSAEDALELREPQVKRIQILEDGGLSSNFGEGFFDEAINLQYDLLKIKKNSGKLASHAILF